MLSLRGRRCLVVGGGGVALRKSLSLIAEGATVEVVAPEVVPEFQELERRGNVSVERRAYRAAEAAGYSLVFAATDRRDVNRQVFEDAEEAGVWVNVADDPELCSFHLPARVRRSSLQVAVASDGEAPFVVRRLRQLLEGRFGPEWAEWARSAARFRTEVRRRRLNPGEEEALFDRFFRETVDADRLTARIPTTNETSSWLATPSPAEAGQSVDRTDTVSGGRGRSLERGEAHQGFVSLVGAGPGGPGLQTVLAQERLLAADAIVYDRLAAPALPCQLSSEVELHCVGKTPGRHPVPQEEINSLLVRLAGEGKRVVRFKGGDPFVFGRGGEEAEALAAADIAFEVVPGITAGIGVPGWIGIPVTYRGEAVRLTLVTAHEASKEVGPQVRWDLLAQDPHATVVAYMGVAALPHAVEQLLAGGMDPEMPAAMVESGTLATQRSVVSSLAKLAELAEREGFRAPAVFVVGPTVRHAASLDWRRRLPLRGERLVVVEAAVELTQALSEAGAEVVPLPVPITPAARVVMGAMPITGCVLLSPAHVDVLDEERGGAGWQAGVVGWCVGREVVARARERGWRWVEEVGQEGGWRELVMRIGRARRAAGTDTGLS